VKEIFGEDQPASYLGGSHTTPPGPEEPTATATDPAVEEALRAFWPAARAANTSGGVVPIPMGDIEAGVAAAAAQARAAERELIVTALRDWRRKLRAGDQWAAVVAADIHQRLSGWAREAGTEEPLCD
jgi:hypothetical protein